MIPIGNLDLRHLIGTLRYFSVPTFRMYGLLITYSLFMFDSPLSLFSLSICHCLG